MNNLTLYQLTQLAEASYAKFDEFPISKQTYALKDKGFSDAQANDLLSHWSIASHRPNTEHGFSATLFQSNDASSQYVLAIRGTEPGLLDLVLTDGGDLVRDGLALDQIVDLYNYWKQLTAPEGTIYQVAVYETLTAETIAYNAAVMAGPLGLPYIASLRARTDIVIDEPTGQVLKVQFVDSNVIYSDSRSQGLGINPDSVTVVGHSLGGHLAAAFSRLFPTATTEALMINGAGFGDGLALSEWRLVA